MLALFAIPGVMMIVAYGLISRELYRGIQFEMGHKKDSSGEAIYTTVLIENIKENIKKIVSLN